MKFSSPSLSGSDLLVILKVALLQGHAWEIEYLSAELDIPVKSILNALEKGRNLKLIESDHTVVIEDLKEFLLYAVQYLFPAHLGSNVKGMITGPKPGLFLGPSLPFVGLWTWPNPDGKAIGAELTPLSSECCFAALNDPKLHLLLSVTDTLRVLGKVARPWASFELSKLLHPLS